MKKIILFLAVTTILSVTGIHTASANHLADHSILSGKPNFKGNENFAKAFPDAMVKSCETKEGFTKVVFNWNGDALEAFYDLNGNLLATNHFLDIKNLPISIQLKIHDEYPGYKIIQAVEFYHMENGLSYYIIVKKSVKALILKIDPNGESNVVKRLKND